MGSFTIAATNLKTKNNTHSPVYNVNTCENEATVNSRNVVYLKSTSQAMDEIQNCGLISQLL
jgi:hypothetical protein